MKNRVILILLLVAFGALGYAEICDYTPPPVEERINNRDYPSIFGSWASVSNRPQILPPLPWLDEKEAIAYFDLYFCCPNTLGLMLVNTDEGVELVGDFDFARERKSALLKFNPNAIMLVPVKYYSGVANKLSPEKDEFLSKLLLRDENGNHIVNNWDEALVNFALPETQEWAIEQAKLYASCGLFDGIFLDHWNSGQRLFGTVTLEEEHVARDNILQGIRSEVGDDFLIMLNTNEAKIPRWAKYANGTFLEANPRLRIGWDDITSVDEQFYGLGYDMEMLRKIEDVLIWSETNFREPRINSLLTFRLNDFPYDSPPNKKLMRMFTTMVLVLSDGYVLFKTLGPQMIWYDFWDAKLGYPVSDKSVNYKGIDGLFIREFTNGWVVYNRSGSDQEIDFESHVSGKSSEITALSHTIPDLDGEIYLKTLRVDINHDGVVNILDLVIVANALNETEPDLNDDGIVNILDLVIVANNFEN